MRDSQPVHATAIIAEDEAHLARFLAERLNALWPELEIVGMASNGPEAQELLEAHHPDVAFLDIRMPGLSGLDVARDAGNAAVVFVTAYDQYAVSAFERAALDYLLKPVTDERLEATLARVKERLALRRSAQRAPAPELVQALALLREHLPVAPAEPGRERLAWIRAAVGQQVRLIPVEEVAYFEANDKYTSVFTADAEALIRTPLRELLRQLDPERFCQIHRGTIVNLSHVVSASRDLAGRVRLHLRSRPAPLPVSRAFAHRFRQM